MCQRLQGLQLWTGLALVRYAALWSTSLPHSDARAEPPLSVLTDRHPSTRPAHSACLARCRPGQGRATFRLRFGQTHYDDAYRYYA
jgi:hypothetical protein